MVAGADNVLEEDIVAGENNHAAKHNAVNDQVNYLTQTLTALAQDVAGIGGGGSGRSDIAVPADRTGLRAGLRGILDGTRDASWLFIGDSTIYGVGSTDKAAPNDSFPTQLIGRLDDTTGYTVGEGWVRPPDTGYGFTDSRWTFGTGWTQPSTNVASGASATSGAAGVLSFVPGEAGDTVEILYAQNASQGSAVVKNGATTLGTITATGSNLLAKATFAFSSGSPTINVQGPTGGGFVLYAIRVTSSAARKIRITNGAKPGTKIADYLDNSFTATGNLADTIDPDVIFIGLNKNDGTQGTAFATWKAGIITLITRYQTAGNTVVLLMETPSSPASYSGIVAREASEATTLRQLAGAYGCGFIDLRTPFGTFAEGTADGLYDDGIHPSTAGYALNAQQVAEWAALAVAA